jgi:hypothetical protein
VNEVQTMAKAGENVGSAVGTAVGTALMTARQSAQAAGKNGMAASRRLASSTTRQTRRRLAEHGIDRAQLKELQDAFAESLWRARHELASKIEPPAHPHRMTSRLRLLMAIAMIGAVAAAIASVVFKRPVQPSETDRDRRSPDHANLATNAVTPPRQFEPSQTGPAQPTAARQTTARDVTGGNGSPAS